MKYSPKKLEQLEDARTDLYVHGFLTDTESKKVQKRIQNWAKKQGVDLQIQPQLSKK